MREEYGTVTVHSITKQVAVIILNIFLRQEVGQKNNLGEDFMCGQKNMNWI
jgi:hypothetical protein